MSSKRHRPHKGGTTPTTESKDRPGVVQFSVSEVAQFSMSLDKGLNSYQQSLPASACSSPALQQIEQRNGASRKPNSG